MMTLAPRCVRVGALGVLVSAAFSLAFAQQPAPSARPPNGAQQPAAGARSAPGAADAGLRQRVEQLEEQLVDIQVVLGTLESLAKGATAPAGGQRSTPGVAAAFSASDAGRVDALETQMRAMAAQLQQMQEQIRTLQAQGVAPSPGAAPAPPPGAAVSSFVPRADPGATERSGFGALTVSPDANGRDEIDRVLQDSRSGTVAAAPADDASPKQLYETAYGYLLQRDYAAAESAFDSFLKHHPNDPLAGNAQYWLGESLYVRGQYRAAAGAFLKGYQTYGHSAKAPESLLKLAMSLQRLGQKDAACSSFGELNTKFPNAPAYVKASAQAERQRAGC